MPNIIQICSGITRGRVCNGELYAHTYSGYDFYAYPITRGK